MTGKPQKFDVSGCTERGDNKFWILFHSGPPAVSEVPIETGKRAIVRDGKVVEVCA